MSSLSKIMGRKTILLLFLVTVISCFSLPDETVAYHGREITLKLNSAELVPAGNSSRIVVQVNYTTNDPSIRNQTVNSVMKVYSLNGTLLKTSSSPDGFSLNNTGTKRHVTSLPNSLINNNATIVVQFTDISKTVPISNPIQTVVALKQPLNVTQESGVEKTSPGIANLS